MQILKPTRFAGALVVIAGFPPFFLLLPHSGRVDALGDLKVR
jgi:hypothetical protein